MGGAGAGWCGQSGSRSAAESTPAACVSTSALDHRAAAATWRRAESMLCGESSKKMSAPKASRSQAFWRRGTARLVQAHPSRRVRITRSCAGAERAVTSAVRMGAASPRRERHLQIVQRRQEAAERAARQRFARAFAFVAAEGFHALFARNPLALVAEDHRVAVEGDAQLALARFAGLLRQDGGHGHITATALTMTLIWKANFSKVGLQKVHGLRFQT